MSAPHAGQTIAIVGGGAIGAALFDVLIERLSAESSLRSKTRILVFEKAARVGPGLAYAKDDGPYVLNQSAQTMSLVPGRRAHFREWLEARGAARPSNEDLFCKREIFGDYVEEHLVVARDKARRAGINVATIRDEVSSFVPRRCGGYRVVTSAEPTIDADVVVLAVGNLPSTKHRDLRAHPGFVASPYPSAAMCSRIPANARVAILGSGLSAIDAALALSATGHEAPLTMASRSGLLPAIRGPLPPHELQYVTRASIARATDRGRRPLRWAELLRWLAMELERCGASVSWDRDFASWASPLAHYESQVAAAERGARLWQSIGEALNPLVETLWHHLADDDKRLFLDQFYSRFMSHWVPIPLVNGRKILALLRDAKLTVERDLIGVTSDATSPELRLRFGDARTTAFDYVVDATGVPRQLADCESPLVDSLLRQGVVSPNEFGGVRVDFDSLRVLGKDGHADPSLFALGNLTSGTHLFTSTLELNVEKADRIAAQIVADLLHRNAPKDHPLHADAPSHST